MANSFVLLLLLAVYAVASPIPRSKHQHTASLQVADVSPSSYIVSLKPNTVDPNARGAWLNNVLASNGHQRRDLSERAGSDLRLGWNETVFNGLAGTFSQAEIQSLSARDEVKYVQPGEQLDEI